MKRVIVALGLIGVFGGTAAAEKIGYVETFALSQDREQVLKYLIPGTEDYYFYHCLHHQQTEQFEEVDRLLKAWIERHRYTPRVHQILNRQALLLYGTNSRRTLQRITERLKLRFDHRRDVLVNPDLPTRLDEGLLQRDRLEKLARQRHRNTQGFEDRALEWLATRRLDATERRHLLERLSRPDIPGLAKLVVADLAEKNSRGFGSLGIHLRLLPTQLEECLELRPSLRNETKFVYAWIQKLQPASHVDWQNDRDAHRAWLDRLWNYVEDLAPSHNSLKAHVLYQRLLFDRAGGEYNRDRFLTYLRLPRSAPYVNPNYLRRREHARFHADLNVDFRSVTRHTKIGNDEPLVRSYLHHFFREENDWKPYTEWIRDTYLKVQFAEAKIVNGLGNPEQWSSLLSPAQFRALQDRVDLDFAHDRTNIIGVDDPVRVEMAVKNVRTLIIKVFEINARNFYRDQGTEISTDIKLDGLVPNFERTETFDVPALRRVDRRFDFPQLNRAGVYVIDFIGNGRSSRVVVRKGKLRYLVRTSTAGHIFTVLDGHNRRVNDASILFGGREYSADKDGQITTPFSNAPGQQPIVLCQGDFASLDTFRHQAENYRLAAAIHVDRESLLSRGAARVVVRPSLSVNGTPVTLSVLDDVQLVIASTDHDGIAATKTVNDFELFEDRESTYEFQVPPRLQSVRFELRARVKVQSQNTKATLSDGRTFAVNQIDRTEKTHDVHLARLGNDYVIELLGRTGERLGDRSVRVTLKHADFRETVTTVLETDNAGHVTLGKLANIDWVSAQSGAAQRQWTLPRDRHSQYQTVHGQVGRAVQIPYTGHSAQAERSEFALLEVRGGTYISDRLGAIEVRDGMVEVNDIPAGDYELWLKNEGRRIQLRLLDGVREADYLLGATRYLQIQDEAPLQIASTQWADDQLKIALKNANEFTRVHVLATRYVPAFSPHDSFSRVRDAEPFLRTIPAVRSLYIAGRKIGDELQYIIDRKRAKKFPGNLVKRPSLLLNPWPVRSTSTVKQQAKKGEDFGATATDSESSSERKSASDAKSEATSDFSDLDFLRRQSTVLLNLEADENGTVTVPFDLLGDRQLLHIVAVDPKQTATRVISRDEVETPFRDLRLAHGLDPKKHFTQQKNVRVVGTGETFVLKDVGGSRFESYDSLERVYSLFMTLSKNPQLAEFRFLLEWPDLDDDAKRAKYSEFACHELHFFLYKKDREFFDAVVLPYLRNKQDKTFLDHWLLDTDLTEYRQPWAFGRLNTVERILLAHRFQDELQPTRQIIGDQFALVRPKLEEVEFLYESALGSSALDVSGAAGVDGLMSETRSKYRLEAAENGPAPPTANFQRQADRPAAARSSPVRRRPGGFRGGRAAGGKRQRNRDSAGGEAAGEEAAEAEEFDDEMKEKDAVESLRKSRRFFQRDTGRRQNVRQFYVKLDKTQEWAENNYFRLPIGQQIADLVQVNAFWKEYAEHDADKPFYSSHFTAAAGNLPEMIMALSVLDLPFKAEEHKSTLEDGRLELVAASPMVVFHQEVQETEPVGDAAPILVSQNFFRHGDRHRIVDNEQVDKYVTDEFLTDTVYGCQVVVTNPTSTRQKLNVLIQIPTGAVPVVNARYTKSIPVDLAGFGTQTLEYHFYFPSAGDFAHFPVHVAKNEELIASADAVVLKVVNEPSSVDTRSWDYISQHGTPEQVVTFLRTENLFRVKLERIAWRMADRDFFRQATALLARRHVYNHVLWSYAVHHDDAAAVRQFLRHADGFIAECGAALDSPLLRIDPVERRLYEHLDYSPLVNARAHRLGGDRQILNDRLHQQYHRFLAIVAARTRPTNNDLMAATYYLLLQDRVDEALDVFDRIDPDQLATRLQYDYFTAFLDLYRGNVDRARELAGKYENFSVDRWRTAFARIREHLDGLEPTELAVADPSTKTDIAAALDEVLPLEETVLATDPRDGDPASEVLVAVAPVDPPPTVSEPTEDREVKQETLAKSEPTFDFRVEAKRIELTSSNIESVTVNFYEMDIELLFSTQPFVKRVSGAFSWIRPNKSVDVPLNGQGTDVIAIPKEFHSSNLLVEIRGAGQTKSQTYYAHSLNVQVAENYGRLTVKHNAERQQPLRQVYVKVYAEMQDGSIRFYKDGYTDLRGQYDYSSLNTNEIEAVRRFSVLVLSEKHGAIVREVAPPQR